jgi:glycosyltransferase involved in cell wall biosynthesis
MTQNALKARHREEAIGIVESAAPRAGHSRLQGARIPVCHVVGGGDWAGAEAQVATLLRGLSKSPDVALHAIVFYDHRLAKELRNAGVEVHVANAQDKSFLRLIAECSQFVKSRRIQVLHSHCYKENILALALSRLCKVPHLVRTEHGLAEPYSAIRNLKHWCVLAADRMAAGYTPDRIIGISSDLGEYWKRHARPEKVMVLRYGVELERIHSEFSAAEAKQRLGISGDEFVIGIGARLEPIKRLDIFVATAAYLSEKIPNSRFVIAGGGRQEQWLRQLVADSGLQERVLLLGERKDVYDVLRALDILLMCSDHEGSPMVMLEAMNLGVAVVSRAVGGIPEVLGAGSAGILVNSESPEVLGRACLQLFEKPDLRASLVQAARREILQNYSAGKNAEAVLELYRSLCDTAVKQDASATGQW